MNPIIVSISGPGGTICYEAEIIRRALEDALCKVVSYKDNYYPPKEGEDLDKFLYEYRQRIISLNLNKEVEIHVHHEPWGG